jgi:hypothetical protein
MSRVRLPHEVNKDVNFVHIANFLVSYRIMTLQEAHSLFRSFHQEKDVVISVPDEVDAEFRRELNSLNCKFEWFTDL